MSVSPAQLAAIGIFLVFVPISSAQTVTLDEDTVIDANSSASGNRIEVIDGPGGPQASASSQAAWRLVSLAVTIAESFLIGGTVMGGGRLEDNASFIMKGGNFTSDSGVFAILLAKDSSELHFFGGLGLQGPFELSDSSVAHIYGQNLELVLNPPGLVPYVTGTFPNGDQAQVYFDWLGRTSPSISCCTMFQSRMQPRWARAQYALFCSHCERSDIA